MSGSSHGYNVSVEYKSYGFYREMAPDWLDFCVRSAGYETGRRGTAFRYLYLGSGQGFGLCVLAAANPDAEFLGVDFQPEHIAHSHGLAQAAGLSNVRFYLLDHGLPCDDDLCEEILAAAKRGNRLLAEREIVAMARHERVVEVRTASSVTP